MRILGERWVEPATAKVVKTVSLLTRDGSPVEGLLPESEWD